MDGRSLLLISLYLTVTNAIIVDIEGVTNESNHTFPSRYSLFGGSLSTISEKNKQISGMVAISSPYDACDEITNPKELKGKIAIINYRGEKTREGRHLYTCKQNGKIQRAQEAGAIGVIFVWDRDIIEGETQLPIADAVSLKIHIPAVTVTNTTGYLLMEHTYTAKVTFTPTSREDLATIGKFRRTWIATRVVVSVVFGVIFLTAIAELVVHYRLLNERKRKERNVDDDAGLATRVMLTEVIVASLMRALYYMVDPYNYENAWPSFIDSFINGICTAIEASIFTLLLLFWITAATRYNRTPKFLPKNLKIVFIVVTTIFAIGQIITSAMFWDGTVSLIYNVLLSIYTFVIAVGFIIYGTRIVLILRGMKLRGSSRHFYKLTGFLFGFAIVSLVLIATILADEFVEGREWLPFELGFRMLEALLLVFVLGLFFNPKVPRSTESSADKNSFQLSGLETVESSTNTN